MPVQDYDPREDGYGSKYLKGSDFADGPVFLTILDVNRVEFNDGSRKLALSFNDGSEATLNKRNYGRLTEKWGEDPNAWIHKTVMLMAGDAYQGKPALVMLPQADQTKLKAPRRPAPAPAAPAQSDNPFEGDGDDDQQIPF